MSWQNDLYQRLRDREWYTAGVLFDEIEQDIPLHTAMRRYLGARKTDQIPTNTEARWLSFKAALSIIGFEVARGNKRGLRWDDQIRLSYVEGEQCPTCDGPVIRRNWSIGNRSFVCLACEKPKLDLDLKVFILPQVCGFPVRLWPHLWWKTEKYFLEDTLYYDAVPHHITITPADADLSDLMPGMLVSDDLITFTMQERGMWHSINTRFVSPPIKHKRRRKRRPKPVRTPTPRLVAPPVIRQPSQLVKKSQVRVKPIIVKVPKTNPVPKPMVITEYNADVETIWGAFVQSADIPNFDQNPKLRRVLHRALEAGIIEEYQQMKVSVEKELVLLGWPDGQKIGNMLGVKGLRWIENSGLREHQRRRWARLLMQAYTAGASGIVVLTTNGRLDEICNEIERLIQSKQPKPPRPPQPVRLRWGAPVRQARNMVSRWFTR